MPNPNNPESAADAARLHEVLASMASATLGAQLEVELERLGAAIAAELLAFQRRTGLLPTSFDVMTETNRLIGSRSADVVLLGVRPRLEVGKWR